MGLFCLAMGDSREDYLKAIRANLDLYERQCHEYEHSYLLECFVQNYLDKLINLEKELPSNWEWNRQKDITSNKENNIKCPKCSSYDLTIRIIAKAEYHKECRDCGYHAEKEEFKEKE